jgi:hypothetical protein
MIRVGRKASLTKEVGVRRNGEIASFGSLGPARYWLAVESLVGKAEAEAPRFAGPYAFVTYDRVRDWGPKTQLSLRRLRTRRTANKRSASGLCTIHSPWLSRLCAESLQ